MKYGCILCILFILFCSAYKSEEQFYTEDNEEINREITVDSSLNVSELKSNSFRIFFPKIENNKLKLLVNYVGYYEDTFTLYFDNTYLKSEPPKAQLYLTLSSDVTETYPEAKIEKLLSFDLGPISANSTIILKNVSNDEVISLEYK